MSHFTPIYLGVNIDHVATLRQSRGTLYPEPVHAALLAEQAGADSITLHLREDRRHIQNRDVEVLRDMLQTKMNLEMAVTDEMLDIAEALSPADVCLVPERREELTTEGGLDVAGQPKKISAACQRMAETNVRVSLFIDANTEQVEAAATCQAPVVELHTGHYADAKNDSERSIELTKIIQASKLAHSLGMQVNAGHGLHYHNVSEIAAIDEIVELNIGHAIIAESIFKGLSVAVSEMKCLMLNARQK